MDALLEPTEPRTAAPGALTSTYVSDGPLDVRQTVGVLLRGATEPTMRFTANGFWRVMRTPEGPVTLHVQWRPAADDECGAPEQPTGPGRVQQHASEVRVRESTAHAHDPELRLRDSDVPLAHRPVRVDARAWGPGSAWALRGLPELLGHDDRGAWDALDLSQVPLLAEVRRRNPGMRLTRTSLVFESLVPSILEQKVTTVEARRSWHRLLRAYGGVPPGPAPEGMLLQPTARQWQLIPSWEWHRAGVGPDRSRTIVAAAAVAASLDRLAVPAPAPWPDAAPSAAVGDSAGRRLDGGSPAAGGVRSAVDAGFDGGASVGGSSGVLARLRSLHGVGAWTAAETTQRSHGHPDAVSVGDYHLAAHVGWVLIGRPVDDEGMLELLEPWRGSRQRIVRLILASGIAKPRFGPRATITDHRWH